MSRRLSFSATSDAASTATGTTATAANTDGTRTGQGEDLSASFNVGSSSLSPSGAAGPSTNNAPTGSASGTTGKHSRTASNVSGVSQASSGSNLTSPGRVTGGASSTLGVSSSSSRAAKQRKTSAGSKFSFGQAVKTLGTRPNQANLANLLGSGTGDASENSSRVPSSWPSPDRSGDKSGPISDEDREGSVVSPMSSRRASEEAGAWSPPTAATTTTGSPSRNTQPTSSSPQAVARNLSFMDVDQPATVVWDGGLTTTFPQTVSDPASAAGGPPDSKPPSVGYLSSNASQTSIIASPDSLFTVTPASSTSTSPAQTRNVTPMGGYGFGQPLTRTLGAIPESPAMGPNGPRSSSQSVPVQSLRGPGAAPLPPVIPPTTSAPTAGSPLTAGTATSNPSTSSPQSSQPRSGGPSSAGNQPYLRSLLDNVDIHDPMFLKLASETAVSSRSSNIAQKQAAGRTSFSRDEQQPVQSQSAPPNLVLTSPTPVPTPTTQRPDGPSPISSPECAARSPPSNVSAETLRRSQNYKSYMEKRYQLMDEVMAGAAEAEGNPGGVPKSNPWNLVDMMRWRERNKQARPVGRASRTSNYQKRISTTPEIQEWYQHVVARQFLLQQRKQQQAEEAEAVARQLQARQPVETKSPDTVGNDSPTARATTPAAYGSPYYPNMPTSEDGDHPDFASDSGGAVRTMSVKTTSPIHYQSPQKSATEGSAAGSSPLPRPGSPVKHAVSPPKSFAQGVRSLATNSEGGSPERERGARGTSEFRSHSKDSEGSLHSSSYMKGVGSKGSTGKQRSGRPDRDQQMEQEQSVRSASPTKDDGSHVAEPLLLKRFLEASFARSETPGTMASEGLSTEDSAADLRTSKTTSSLDRMKRPSASQLPPLETANVASALPATLSTASTVSPPTAVNKSALQDRRSFDSQEDGPISAAMLYSEGLSGAADALFDGIDAAKNKLERAGKKVFGALTFANARKRHKERLEGQADEGEDEVEAGDAQPRRSIDAGPPPTMSTSWSVRIPGWPEAPPRSSKSTPVPPLAGVSPNKLIPGASATVPMRTTTPQPPLPLGRTSSRQNLFRSNTPQPSSTSPAAIVSKSFGAQTSSITDKIPFVGSKSRSFALFPSTETEQDQTASFAWDEPGGKSSLRKEASRKTMSDDEREDNVSESGQKDSSGRRARRRRSASFDNAAMQDLIQKAMRDNEAESKNGDQDKLGVERKKTSGILGFIRGIPGAPGSGKATTTASRRGRASPEPDVPPLRPTRPDGKEVGVDQLHRPSLTPANSEHLDSIAEIPVLEVTPTIGVTTIEVPDFATELYGEPVEHFSAKDLAELKDHVRKQGSLLLLADSVTMGTLRAPKELQGVSERVDAVNHGYEAMSVRIEVVAAKIDVVRKLRKEAIEMLSEIMSTPIKLRDPKMEHHRMGSLADSFEAAPYGGNRRHPSFGSFTEPLTPPSRSTSPSRSVTNFPVGVPALSGSNSGGGARPPYEDILSQSPVTMEIPQMRSPELGGRADFGRSLGSFHSYSEEFTVDAEASAEKLRDMNTMVELSLLPRALAVQKQYHDLENSIKKLSIQLAKWSEEVNKSWLPTLHAAEEELERLEDRGRSPARTWEEAGFLVLSYVLATLGNAIWVTYHAQVTVRTTLRTGTEAGYHVLHSAGITAPVERFVGQLIESDVAAARDIGEVSYTLPGTFVA